MKTGIRHRFIFVIAFLFLVLSISQAQNQLTLSQIEFHSSFELFPSKLLKLSELKNGQNLTLKQIPVITKNLEKALYDEGYLYARVDSVQLKHGLDATKIGLKFYGKCGPQTFVSKVEVKSDSLPAEMYLQQISAMENLPFAGSKTEAALNAFLKKASSEGFLFAEAKLQTPKLTVAEGKSTVDLTFEIHEHNRVYIQSIKIEGNTYTKEYVALRELDVHPGDLYTNKAIDQMVTQLNRLSIFKSVKNPVIFRTHPDSVAISIEVEEGNASSFDGVIGYIPESNNDGSGYFTGLIDLSFKNLFGSGRKFTAHWKKSDKLSEEFLLAYTEPWILGYPIDMGVQMERNVRDTSYVQWNYALNTRLNIFRDLAIVAKVQQDLYVPDSAASYDRRLVKNRVINLQAGVEYDTRDYPQNPRSGIYYYSAYTLGLKQNLGPAYLLKEDSLLKKEDLHSVQMQLDFYYNLWSNQVLALQMSGSQIEGNQLQLTDYFWFGGSRSLRGYRENQFRGSRVGWLNLEYRFLLGGNARFFLFNDWGYYHYKTKELKSDDLLYGYGLGIRFDSPLGIMAVDFGLGKGDSFREAKIHFGLVNQF